MGVSVVVPFHSGRAYLEFCLTSLAREDAWFDEIIIVSNHPTNSAPVGLTHSPKIRLLHFSEALGYGPAINIGAEEAKGDILFFCDADSYFSQSGWLKHHLDMHRVRPEVGITSSKIVDYNTGRVLDFGIGRTARNHFHPFLDVHHSVAATNVDRKVQMACSAAMAMSRELFFEVGGHDENLIHFYQDVDLCLRVNELGREVWIASKALAHHRLASTSVTRKPFKVDEFGYYSAKNAHRFVIDFPEFFAEQLAESREYFQKKLPYGLVDLSTVNTLDEFLEPLGRLARIEPIFSACPPQRDCADLYLVEIVPHDLYRHAAPLLFLVDRHHCLRHNSVWSYARDTSRDIVVDRHGTVRRFDDIVSNGRFI